MYDYFFDGVETYTEVGSSMTKEEKERFIAMLKSEPRRFIAQEVIDFLDIDIIEKG